MASLNTAASLALVQASPGSFGDPGFSCELELFFVPLYFNLIPEDENSACCLSLVSGIPDYRLAPPYVRIHHLSFAGDNIIFVFPAPDNLRLNRWRTERLEYSQNFLYLAT